MSYIVTAKEITGAIEQLADALDEKDYRHRSSDLMVWEIGGKKYRVLEPKKCRIAVGENGKAVRLYDYEIEEMERK